MKSPFFYTGFFCGAFPLSSAVQENHLEIKCNLPKIILASGSQSMNELRPKRLTELLALTIITLACQTSLQASTLRLASEASTESQMAWKDLFAANDFSEWTNLKGEPVRSGWSIQDGIVFRESKNGGIITKNDYVDFELKFEWKISEGGNSGVKYRTIKRKGLEYQILDDDKHKDGQNSTHRAASMYDLIAAPDSKPVKPVGDWNKGRIVAKDSKIEHWLNGKKVIDTDLSSEDWIRRFQNSKYKNLDGFGTWPGPILLQDHGDHVWFRNVLIRDLSPPDQWTDLFDGKTLDNWKINSPKEHRIARVVDEEIHLIAEKPGKFFLVYDKPFTDFIFEAEVKMPEGKSNSGFMFRGQWDRESGKISGYQAEVDPSDRKWSGGLYDEGRRKWFISPNRDAAESDEAKNASIEAFRERAGEAFQRHDWNQYRIECRGNQIKIFVNGVLTTDIEDGMDASGYFALQHHGEKGKVYRFRNVRVQELD